MLLALSRPLAHQECFAGTTVYLSAGGYRSSGGLCLGFVAWIRKTQDVFKPDSQLKAPHSGSALLAWSAPPN